MNKKKRQSIEETIEEKSPDRNGAATALIPSTLTNVWLFMCNLFSLKIFSSTIDCYTLSMKIKMFVVGCMYNTRNKKDEKESSSLIFYGKNLQEKLFAKTK